MCDPLETPRPLGPLLDLAAGLSPDFPARVILGPRDGGQLLAADALDSDDARTLVCDLGFCRVEPEEAQRLSDQDPAIRAGIYPGRDVHLLRPPGGLAFPLEAGG